jgi:hypothetical protein
MRQLKELSKSTGIPMSEMLRRLIREYLKKESAHD